MKTPSLRDVPDAGPHGDYPASPEDQRPRFIVAALTGGSIPSGRISTVYSVLDRAFCHQEVRRYGSGEFGTGQSDAVRRARAERFAEALNRWDDES